MKALTEFKNLAEFMDYFHDEQACVEHFTQSRFRNGEYCPHCNHNKIYKCAGGKRYHCAKCKQDFTIRTKTVFGESKLPLRKWYIAVYLLSTTSKGISSVQLAKHIGVTQKTAWFMAHRIRAAKTQPTGQLSGAIEVDETYVGGSEKNKHASKRTRGTQGRSARTKTPIVGMIQRDGEVRARVVPNVSAFALETRILRNVADGSRIMTDDFLAYSRIGHKFSHSVISHAKGEYVKGDVHTNTIESFWALFKRGYMGVYHWMSKKHMQRYVDEFAFRFNRRESEMQTVFSKVVSNVVRTPHLGYNQLTEKTV